MQNKYMVGPRQPFLKFSFNWASSVLGGPATLKLYKVPFGALHVCSYECLLRLQLSLGGRVGVAYCWACQEDQPHPFGMKVDVENGGEYARIRHNRQSLK